MGCDPGDAALQLRIGSIEDHLLEVKEYWNSFGFLIVPTNDAHRRCVCCSKPTLETR